MQLNVWNDEYQYVIRNLLLVFSTYINSYYAKKVITEKQHKS